MGSVCDTIIGMCAPSARCAITEHGLRCTPQREAVFDALRQAHDHPTADELFARVEGVSKATVYNALEAFRGVGLAQAISVQGGVTRWDPKVGPHVHMRHAGSDAVSDLPDSVAAPLLSGLTTERLQTVAEAMGVTIDAVQVSLLVHDDSAAAGGDDAS